MGRHVSGCAGKRSRACLVRSQRGRITRAPQFTLFHRRVEKLVDLFTTVDQFTVLAKHNLEGMDGLMNNFFAMVSDFKRKPYDLFDFAANQFDRDYLEFLANIHELESSLQSYINVSFENITSTESALAMLMQLRKILQRVRYQAPAAPPRPRPRGALSTSSAVGSKFVTHVPSLLPFTSHSRHLPT